MGRKILMLALVACSHGDSIPDATVVQADASVPIDAGHIQCSNLNTEATCCFLACVDDPRFHTAECGVAGYCLTYACPLYGGGFYTPEVCL